MPGLHDGDVARGVAGARRRGRAGRAALRARRLRAARWGTPERSRELGERRGTPRAPRRRRRPRPRAARRWRRARRSSTRPMSARVRPAPGARGCGPAARGARAPYQATRPSRSGGGEQPALLVEADRVDRHVGPPASSSTRHSVHGSILGAITPTVGIGRPCGATWTSRPACASRRRRWRPPRRRRSRTTSIDQLVGAAPAVGLGAARRPPARAGARGGPRWASSRRCAPASAHASSTTWSRARRGSRGRAASARSASIGSPVIASSSAIASGTRLGSRISPPAAAIRPRLHLGDAEASACRPRPRGRTTARSRSRPRAPVRSRPR